VSLPLFAWALVPAAYLAGSVPFGVLLTRWFKGKDVRGEGSGNIGATNVARTAGKGLGALVLLLDAAKGALPVLLAQALFAPALWLHGAVGLAAFLGHVFPVWLSFKGGKGVATAMGVLAVLTPFSALVGVAVFGLLAALFRISSVGSLAGGAAAVASAFLWGPTREYAALAAALFVMMLFTHRANIGRLLRRRELKF
jgi:acyl phosphate:glycerol-3-phosphate acyltransferase